MAAGVGALHTHSQTRKIIRVHAHKHAPPQRDQHEDEEDEEHHCGGGGGGGVPNHISRPPPPTSQPAHSATGAAERIGDTAAGAASGVSARRGGIYSFAYAVYTHTTTKHNRDEYTSTTITTTIRRPHCYVKCICE